MSFTSKLENQFLKNHLHLNASSPILVRLNTRKYMLKYNTRERILVRNIRKLIDMMTNPTLITLLTDKEYKMVMKIKGELKKI